MGNLKKFSFLDDFEIPQVSHDLVKQQLSKSGKLKSIKSNSSLNNIPLEDRLNIIYKEVYKVLGRYKGFVRTIRSESEFNEYIDKAISCGFLALDTETNNSLDPLTCKLMGLCLYIPNTKPVYVPVNHSKINSNELLEDQVSLDCIKNAFDKLKKSNIKIIYHNGKFDIRVCYNVTGVYLPIWWDTMIAAQLLNENELARLKYQYKLHVDPTIGTYNIEKLFTGLPYAWIDPEVFALYAAIDAYDTYILQQEQLKIFSKPDMAKLYNLYRNVELPIVLVTSKMEDDGISIDLDYLSKLDKIYIDNRQICYDKMLEILSSYKSKLNYYENLGKIDNPVNFDSPQQLCIILYDILEIPVPEVGRVTGKEYLENIDSEFIKLLLDYKLYSKMISSFTSSWPEHVSEKDGKIHASFNQMGKEENNVRTGRFSSTDPNLQQIPSHEGVLRMAFKASTEYAEKELNTNSEINLYNYEEVETTSGWCFAANLKIGDQIKIYDSDNDTHINMHIKKINVDSTNVKIFLESI